MVLGMSTPEKHLGLPEAALLKLAHNQSKSLHLKNMITKLNTLNTLTPHLPTTTADNTKLLACRDWMVCGWREPPLRSFVGAPVCSVETNGSYADDGATLAGHLYRITSCQLQYGPMNCDFIWGGTNE